MKRFALLSILFSLSILLSGQCPDVLPTSDFSANFCQFPFAWEVTRGEGSHISILTTDGTADPVLSSRLQFLVPGGKLQFSSMHDFINRGINNENNQVFWLTAEIPSSEYEAFLDAVDSYEDAIVVMSAYYGPMDTSRNYTAWRGFVKEASIHGVIITGSHGDMFQLGDLSFWKEVPVDIFAVMDRDIDGFQAMMPGYPIDVNLEKASCLVAGAVALLKSRHPEYSPRLVKDMIGQHAVKVWWSLIGVPAGKGDMVLAIPHFKRDYLGKYEDSQIRKIERNVYNANSLNVRRLFGIECPEFGGWCLSAMHVKEAREISTGQNVRVAVLDHTFNRHHPALEGRVVDPVSFIEGVPALAENTDHGTTMVRDLTMVAPGVKVIPVVIAGEGHWGDADLMIKGINYAVDHGADIICCSQMAVKGNQDQLDNAVRRATEMGVTFVYINYHGQRNDVIIPGPVEFKKYQERNDIVNVIGTNFTDNESPVTWGVSHSAPVTAGVIAMMKAVRPELTPAEIKSILLSSVRKTYDGSEILDALLAMKNIIN